MANSTGKRQINVVVIKGDGIGPELVDASLVVLEALQRRDEGFEVDLDFHGGASI